MKITPIQFNFVQSKPQNTVSNPVSMIRMNKGLQCDTVSFSANAVSSHEDFYGREKLRELVPKHKGIIYKKVRDKDGNIIKKVPVEVDIVKIYADTFSFELDGEDLGYVELSYISKKNCRKARNDNYLYKDYKEEGIKGGRIIVDMLENDAEDEYGGIGHLADLLEVAVCKELGIKPNVVSESFSDATPMHYKRGKRFVPYEKYVSKGALRSLKGQNPNKSVKEEIDRTLEGEEFDTPDLYHELVMYMPKKMIKELEEELKEHPIF